MTTKYEWITKTLTALNKYRKTVFTIIVLAILLALSMSGYKCENKKKGISIEKSSIKLRKGVEWYLENLKLYKEILKVIME